MVCRFLVSLRFENTLNKPTLTHTFPARDLHTHGTHLFSSENVLSDRASLWSVPNLAFSHNHMGLTSMSFSSSQQWKPAFFPEKASPFLYLLYECLTWGIMSDSELLFKPQEVQWKECATTWLPEVAEGYINWAILQIACANFHMVFWP